MLIQLGRTAIEYAIVIKSLTEAQKPSITNPALVAALGVAAVAAGTALKSAFKKSKLPQFAEGGIASGPQSGYLAVLHGQELVVPLNKTGAPVGFPEHLSVEFIGQLRGEDVYWIMQKINQRKGRV